MSELIPIFPLELVVYPGEALNLHIFEPRYQELINDCVKTKKPFGVPTVLNRQIGQLGTLVRLQSITNVQADGQMDIRTEGGRIFCITKLLKLFPGKSYSAAMVDILELSTAEKPGGMKEIMANIKKLHAALNIEKKFTKPSAQLLSYDVAHHCGLSLKQEYELLGLVAETERQEYLRRHLERILPVVAELELLKQKIRLNGHFKHLPSFEV